MPQGAELFTEQNEVIGQLTKQGIPKAGHVDVKRRRMVIGEIDNTGSVLDGRTSLAAGWTQPGTDYTAVGLTSHVDDKTPIPLEALGLSPIPRDEVAITFMQGNWSAMKIELNPESRTRVTVQDHDRVQYHHDLALTNEPSAIVRELGNIVVHNEGPNRNQMAVMLQALSELYEANGMEEHASKCREELQKRIPKIKVHGEGASRPRGRY